MSVQQFIPFGLKARPIWNPCCHKVTYQRFSRIEVWSPWSRSIHLCVSHTALRIAASIAAVTHSLTHTLARTHSLAYFLPFTNWSGCFVGSEKGNVTWEISSEMSFYLPAAEPSCCVQTSMESNEQETSFHSNYIRRPMVQKVWTDFQTQENAFSVLSVWRLWIPGSVNVNDYAYWIYHYW